MLRKKVTLQNDIKSVINFTWSLKTWILYIVTYIFYSIQGKDKYQNSIELGVGYLDIRYVSVFASLFAWNIIVKIIII